MCNVSESDLVNGNNFTKELETKFDNAKNKIIYISTLIESEISQNMAQWLIYLGWVLLLGPGPAYIHLSWAPRWRILCRLEEGLDPFEGDLPPPENEDIMEDSDEDMEVVIDSIEEEPPVLYQADSEE